MQQRAIQLQLAKANSKTWFPTKSKQLPFIFSSNVFACSGKSYFPLLMSKFLPPSQSGGCTVYHLTTCLADATLLRPKTLHAAVNALLAYNTLFHCLCIAIFLKHEIFRLIYNLTQHSQEHRNLSKQTKLKSSDASTLHTSVLLPYR